MSNGITINGKQFIPARKAGEFVSYGSDYISKLAREGKIEGSRVGSRWYVNLDSLLAFVETTKKEKELRAEKIRAERKLEQTVHRQVVVHTDARKSLAVLQTLVIAVIGLSVGVAGFAVRVPSTPVASVIESEQFSLVDRLALFVYEFFTPHTEMVIVEHQVVVEGGDPHLEQVEQQDEMSIVGSVSEDKRALFVVPPDETEEAFIASVKEQFSDEVDVTVDESGTRGEIVPIFRERRGETYRFVTVPMTADEIESNAQGG